MTLALSILILSIGLFYVWMFVSDTLPSTRIFQTVYMLMASPVYHLTVIVSIGLIFAGEYAVDAYLKIIHPTSADYFRYLIKEGIDNREEAYEQFRL